MQLIPMYVNLGPHRDDLIESSEYFANTELTPKIALSEFKKEYKVIMMLKMLTELPAIQDMNIVIKMLLAGLLATSQATFSFNSAIDSRDRRP